MSTKSAPLAELLSITRLRPADEQQNLMLAVASLYEGEAHRLPQAKRSVLDELFVALVLESDLKLRQTLAQHIAPESWVPHPLITKLSTDEFSVAEPVLKLSPLLTEADLLNVALTTSENHRRIVAGREHLTDVITSVLIRKDEAGVLTVLAKNTHAHISDEDMVRLVSASRRVIDMRESLALHPLMNRHLAEHLYIWASDALRETLVNRFQVDAKALDRILNKRAASETESHNEPTSPDLSSPLIEANLAQKLHQTGLLSPGYLMRALKNDRLELFLQGLSILTGIPYDQIQGACQGISSKPLALICSSAGYDRLIFPILLADIRRLNKGFPKETFGENDRLAQVFRLSNERAKETFFELYQSGMV